MNIEDEKEDEKENIMNRSEIELAPADSSVYYGSCLEEPLTSIVAESRKCTTTSSKDKRVSEMINNDTNNSDNSNENDYTLALIAPNDKNTVFGLQNLDNDSTFS